MEPPEPPRESRRRAAGRRARRGAAEDAERAWNGLGRELYAIAGFSLIASITHYATHGASGIVFFVGLTTTLLADLFALGLAQGLGGLMLAIAGLFDVFVAALFLTAGWFASRGSGLALAAGAVLYALDGLMALGAALLFGDTMFWMMAGFHGFILLAIFGRWNRARELVRQSLPPEPRGLAAELAP